MEQLLYAALILENMPQPIGDAAREPYGARAVVYALLLDRDADMRRRQLAALKARAEALSYRETERLSPLVDNLPDEARLPLVDMTLPALKQLSGDQYATFRENVDALIEADEKLDLLEYTVRTMLLRQLDVPFGRAKPTAVRYRRLDPLLPSLVAVLSTLAYAGQESEADVRRAFDAAMAAAGRTGSPLAQSDCSLRNLDAALDALAEAAPKLKRDILSACITCVAADGKVTPREGQLIHAVAAVLDIPIPPIAATKTT